MVKKPKYLACETWGVFALLMFVGGFYGAYTFLMRGGVFCNAQTGNLLLVGIHLAKQEFSSALYYVIPFCGYILGTIVSEILPTPIKKYGHIRWDTLLVLIEMVAVIVLGCLPETVPYQVSQVTINFLCAMQFNTFRQMEGISMATTFCTNHVRQVGVSLVKALKKEEGGWWNRFLKHSSLLLLFVAGVTVAALLCIVLRGYAILFALIPLCLVAVRLLYADLKTEKAFLNEKPHGH